MHNQNDDSRLYYKYWEYLQEGLDEYLLSGMLDSFFSIARAEENSVQGQQVSQPENPMLLKKLEELRAIPEFVQTEDDAQERWGRPLVYKTHTDSLSYSDKHIISINPDDVGIRVPVTTMPDVPESIRALEGDEYWEAFDKWEREHESMPLSWERIITHELMHSAYGTTNGLVNDHHKIIKMTNDIMSEHYDEQDRKLFDDGIY